MYMYILFASRYPTSPSEGSFLYDCLNEGVANLRKHRKLGTRDGHNWDVRNGHNSTCKPKPDLTKSTESKRKHPYINIKVIVMNISNITSR